MEINALVMLEIDGLKITDRLNESLKVTLKDGEVFFFKFVGYKITFIENVSNLILLGYDEEGMNKELSLGEVKKIHHKRG